MMRREYLAVLLLVGCAQQPVSFTHPTANQAQYDRDRDRCIYEAKAAVASYNSGPAGPTMANAIGQGIGEGLVMAERGRELAILCMKARGYRPIEVAQ